MMTLLQCEGMNSWVHACSGFCIPGRVAGLVKTAYTVILIAIPLLLIITGMITLASSIMKQKEEDIKKAQQLLIKKFVVGAIVFFLFSLVRWLVVYFDGNIANCFSALINYDESEHACVRSGDSVVGENCSVTTNNNEFFDTNNQCRADGSDGAVKINGNAPQCYVKDYEHCCCDSGDPFMYTTGSDQTNCYCAIQSEDEDKRYVVTAVRGKTKDNGVCQ